MKAARLLKLARRRAGLSQRELADRLGVPQSHIAKIESGTVVPRVDTLDRFLAACGETLESVPRPGIGVDRTGYREMLRLTPRERLESAAASAAGLKRFLEAAGRR